MPSQRDISNNPTRIVKTEYGFAGEVQDVIGWVRTTRGQFETEEDANRQLIGAGYRDALAKPN